MVRVETLSRKHGGIAPSPANAWANQSRITVAMVAPLIGETAAIIGSEDFRPAACFALHETEGKNLTLTKTNDAAAARRLRPE